MPAIDLGRNDAEPRVDESKRQQVRKFFPRILLEKIPNELSGKDIGFEGTATIRYKVVSKEMFEFDFGEKSSMNISIQDIAFKNIGT